MIAGDQDLPFSLSIQELSAYLLAVKAQGTTKERTGATPHSSVCSRFRFLGKVGVGVNKRLQGTAPRTYTDRQAVDYTVRSNEPLWPCPASPMFSKHVKCGLNSRAYPTKSSRSWIQK